MESCIHPTLAVAFPPNPSPGRLPKFPIPAESATAIEKEIEMRSNGKIKIEKGIPIPPRSHRAKYPWETMEIGDSFFAPSANMASSVSLARKRYQREFTTRPEGTGTRVWREA